MEQVRRAIRLRHYSRRTEEAYAGWIRRYIRFHGIRHPDALGPEHITSFLSALATDGHVSASTQNQALCAVLFMYRVVLGRDLGDSQGVVRARASKRLPGVHVFNMNASRKTPVLTTDDVTRLGYKLMIFPNFTMLAAIKAMAEVLGEIRRSGSVAGVLEGCAAFEEFTALGGLAQLQEVEKRFAA